MSIPNEFQAQPIITIYYTYETLEQSSRCEMLERVQTHSNLVKEVSVDLPQMSPLMTQKQVLVTAS